MDFRKASHERLDSTMNKKVISIGFIVLLFGASLVNLFIPQKEFSENENRYLQQFPTLNVDDLLSGKFGTDFDAYSADQFFGRDAWIGMKTIAELALFKKDNGRVYFGGDSTLFDASETIDDAQLARNADALVALVRAMREENPSLSASALLIPTASAILSDKLPPFAPVPDQDAAITLATEKLGSDLPVYDTTAVLREHAGEELLYYRTDHHWTTDAAYLVYDAWARQRGLTPLPSDAFTRETVSDEFYGTLYSKANLFSLRPDKVTAYRLKEPIAVRVDYGKDDVRDTLYQDEFLEKKDKYSYFLGGNHPQVEINTSTKNGKVLLLIKDSYAHCFVPFLAAHYETILMLDPRYLVTDVAALAQEKGVTDLLVLYNLPNFAVDKNVPRVTPMD